MSVRYDVAVVGAGPGGAWAARSLARRGARVLLVDGSHPREKPCGGGITGRGLALVADVLDGARLPIVTIQLARFLSDLSRSSAEVALHPGGLAVASRAELDACLAAAATHSGARLLAERATEVRAMRGHFEVQTRSGTYAAAALIGADGANSLVRRRLCTPFARDRLSIATGFFAHGVTSARIDVEFVDEPAGYIWSFPRPGHLAIGICAQAAPGVTPSRLQSAAARWIARTRIADGARLQPYSWPIPSLPATELESLAPSGDGWFLVGDAAGLVDPLTREGIYFALLSGEWAADALATDSPRASQEYTARVRDEIGTELAVAARMKDRFFRPRVTRLLIDGLRQSAPLRDVMVDLVAGRQSYRTLKWRLLKTWEIGLAARLLVGRAAGQRP